MAQADCLRDMILESAKPGKRDAKLFNLTQKEAYVKHWLQGPCNQGEVTDMLGTWLPVRCFSVMQEGSCVP